MPNSLHNIYHICTAKSASRWFVRFFTKIKQFTGLRRYNYEKNWDVRPWTDRTIEITIPTNTVCTPLYIGLNCYLEIPKPKHYRAFCLWRDPRDVVVSFYYSVRYSHPQIGLHPVWRKELKTLNLNNGIIWTIHKLDDMKIFDALKGYEQCTEKDPKCALYRYRDFFGNNHANEVAKLCDWLKITMPQNTLNKILKEISFENISGRKKGETNKYHHLRKGIAGDWKNHFTPQIKQVFLKVYGDHQIS